MVIEIKLMITNNFMFSEDNDEERVMHTKSWVIIKQINLQKKNFNHSFLYKNWFGNIKEI